MKALHLLLCLAPALGACAGGADDDAGATCQANSPVLQYRLHRDQDATSGQYSPGFNVALVEVAVRLDAATVAPVACGELRGVRFHWWSRPPVAFAVRVYGAGTATGPGPLLREEAIASYLEMDWTVVPLSEPLPLDGGDLWIALAATMPGPGYATIGMDAGPRIPGVSFTHLAGAWAEYEGDHNFGIQALVYH